MKEYCIKTLGMPEKNIHLVTDATLNDIRAEVDWMRQVAEVFKGDAQIIFFYAGHGVPNEKTHDAYLLPADGYGKNLITAYSLEDLYRNMSQCSTRNTLVFLDACFSGKQRSGQELTSARAVGISVKRTVPKGNMVVFSAAEGDQTAFPYKEKKHGMFTYFLLKKLQEEKGNVNLGELSSYITEKVQRTSVIDGKLQTPSVQPSSSMTDRWKSICL